MGSTPSMAGPRARASKPYGAAWLDASDIDEQRRICAKLQMQLWQDVPYIPMGEYWQSTAYRKDLLDVLPGCFAVFYGVRRA
jgi:peptide/nickel transport system substrate-binding protein